MEKFLSNLPGWLRDIIIDFVGTLFAAIGIYNFVEKAAFLPGGISGIGLIIQHFTNLPIGVLNLMLNVPIFFFSYKYLGKNFILRTLRTLVIMTINMDFVAPLMGQYVVEPGRLDQQLMAAIFGGVFVGVGLAIVFMNNSTTGGTDLIVMSINKVHPHMSVGQIVAVVDIIIILMGFLIFGTLESVLCGIIFAYVCGKFIDAVMLGSSSGKMALIITDDGLGMGREIDEKVNRGSTIIQGKGSYTHADKEIVLCALSRNQLPKLRKVIKEYDSKALIIILEYNEVYGTGFKSLMQQH